MSTTFNFEELDEATHDYLVAVRDSEGMGSPGIFAATKDALPGCGCIAGPIIIVVTLVCTLTTVLNIIYKEPLGVALLQTAGLLVGGWLLVAGFRGGKGSNKIAGTWVYVDPLFLYEAYREQITLTPVEEVVEASFTHNYNNGNYQNSVVRISMGGNRVTMVTLANEARAEQMVVYLNYLAWARGPDGGERANLAPATLGGLAKYVAKNDHEPLDSENNINLNLIELDITEVPEEPSREGRSIPGFLPYILMLVFGVMCYFFMAYVVNPPLRDNAIFDAVMQEPYVEPLRLRQYLSDPRNAAHREEVTKRLSRFYDQPIAHVKEKGTDHELREGMAKLLDSVRTTEEPIVSVRVTEQGTPAGQEARKASREKDLRTQFVLGVIDEFSKAPWGQAIKLPEGSPPTTPIGSQLFDFIEAPEGAEKVHFDISYAINQADFGYQITVTVEIRANIEDKNPTARSQFTLPDKFDGSKLDEQVAKMKGELVSRMVGVSGNAPQLPGPQPPMFVP